ncbi:ZC3H3 protein [Capsaspora owczarzaki ATCC 30864]|nr:ZC3H3 protein [Capsaspora owczarzaki ATCC 30864]|eukprot:XP_004363381.2 ZC3H3 protein [Capsaspora owczarzaki ATCC 30864]
MTGKAPLRTSASLSRINPSQVQGNSWHSTQGMQPPTRTNQWKNPAVPSSSSHAATQSATTSQTQSSSLSSMPGGQTSPPPPHGLPIATPAQPASQPARATTNFTSKPTANDPNAPRSNQWIRSSTGQAPTKQPDAAPATAVSRMSNVYINPTIAASNPPGATAHQPRPARPPSVQSTISLKSAPYARGTRTKGLARGRSFRSQNAAALPAEEKVTILGIPYLKTNRGGSSRRAKPGNMTLVRDMAVMKRATSTSNDPGHSTRTASTRSGPRARQSSRSHLHGSQPPKENCTYFMKYGKCQRGLACPFVHDKATVAICKPFLHGTCPATDGSCLLSHRLSRAKMPVCSFFLQGRCSNDACPYSHVNVAPDAPVCENFVKGHCPDGELCKKKHTFVCEDFRRTGACPRGTKCNLQHRTAKRRAQPKHETGANDNEEAPTTNHPTTTTSATTETEAEPGSESESDSDVEDESYVDDERLKDAEDYLQLEIDSGHGFSAAQDDDLEADGSSSEFYDETSDGDAPSSDGDSDFDDDDAEVDEEEYEEEQNEEEGASDKGADDDLGRVDNPAAATSIAILSSHGPPDLPRLSEKRALVAQPEIIRLHSDLESTSSSDTAAVKRSRWESSTLSADAIRPRFLQAKKQ